MALCLFNEPWIGPCKETRCSDNDYCCSKHAAEKCEVCGFQAFTRCQASIGLMCGVPLCDLCGHGAMCLQHASGRGPIELLRYLLGGGPVSSVFGSAKVYAEERERVEKQLAQLRHYFTPPTPTI